MEKKTKHMEGQHPNSLNRRGYRNYMQALSELYAVKDEILDTHVQNENKEDNPNNEKG